LQRNKVRGRFGLVQSFLRLRLNNRLECAERLQ